MTAAMLTSGNRASSRRGILKAAALMPAGWAGAAYANDAPEQREVNIGFVAVESGAPLVVAQ